MPMELPEDSGGVIGGVEYSIDEKMTSDMMMTDIIAKTLNHQTERK